MLNNNVTAVILAAGKGTRMKSKHPKVLQKILDKPMIQYIYEALQAAGIEEKIVVVGYKEQEVIDYMGNKVKYAFQDVQLGTGHAVAQVESLLTGREDHILVVCGDTPLITSSTIKRLIEQHINDNNSITVLTAEVDEPGEYGRIIRDSNGNILKIVNSTEVTDTEREIKEINSGVICFDAKHLFEALKEIINNSFKNEYYITSVLEVMLNKGYKAGTLKIFDYTEILGANTREQLLKLQSILFNKTIARHMEQGVGIIDPDATYISTSVKIGMDTIIYPGTILEGNTVIGEDCIIGPNTRIVSSNIGNNVIIQNSVVIETNIQEGSIIGPFEYLGPQMNKKGSE